MMDAEALAEFSANPAFQGINVNQEAWKFRAWCETNQKTQTKRRFLNWLMNVK